MKIKYTIKKPIIKEYIKRWTILTVKFDTIEDCENFYRKWVVRMDKTFGSCEQINKDLLNWAKKRFQSCECKTMLGYYILEDNDVCHEGYDRGDLPKENIFNAKLFL